MNTGAFLVVFAFLVWSLAGCSKPASGPKTQPKVWDLGVVEVADGVQIQRDLGGGKTCTILPAMQKDGSVLMSLKVMQDGRLVASPRIQTDSDKPAVMMIGDMSIGVTPRFKSVPGDKEVVLTGRHMSEQQVAEIAGRELPKIQNFSCQFTNGVWEVWEVQAGAWVSTATTNADGHIVVHSEHPTQLVLRVNDADGSVERESMN